MATYVDSSALVKLAVREPESLALRRYLRRRQPLFSSALVRTEVLRALLPAGDEAVARGRAVLQRIDLVRVNDRILHAAGVLRPPELRSLDAIHLAAAQELGDELSALVTYDGRLEFHQLPRDAWLLNEGDPVRTGAAVESAAPIPTPVL